MTILLLNITKKKNVKIAKLYSITPIQQSSLSGFVAVHIGTAHPHIMKDGSMIFYGTNMDYSRAYNFISIPPSPNSSECEYLNVSFT